MEKRDDVRYASFTKAISAPWIIFTETYFMLSLVLSDLFFNLLYHAHVLVKKSFCNSFSKTIKTFSSTPLSCPSLYFLHQFGNFHPYSSRHATFTAMYPLSLLLHFHHSSPRELIASSFVLAEQRGNNGRVGLVVVATGMRWEEGERQEGRLWGRETKKKESGASTEGMLVVSWAAGKRAPANYTWVYAHRN